MEVIVNTIKDGYLLTLFSFSEEFTVNLHVTGCSCVSSITGVNPRINHVALQDLKKPFPSHRINAQVFAWLHLCSVLEMDMISHDVVSYGIKDG